MTPSPCVHPDIHQSRTPKNPSAPQIKVDWCRFKRGVTCDSVILCRRRSSLWIRGPITSRCTAPHGGKKRKRCSIFHMAAWFNVKSTCGESVWTVIALEGCKQKQAAESDINHGPSLFFLFFLAPIGVKQSSGWGRAVWQLRWWTSRGKSKYECRTRERGSVRGWPCLRRSGAPAGTSLPTPTGCSEVSAAGTIWTTFGSECGKSFFLNIFIFIFSILGMLLRSVSGSCQRRQLWSCFRCLFWLSFYFAAQRARKQEVVAVTGRKLWIWNTLIYLYTFTYKLRRGFIIAW